VEGGGVVSICLRGGVEPSRSILGGGDPEVEGGSSRGGVEPRFGSPGMVQLVEERRITVPTRERKVFLGGGVTDWADMVSRWFRSDPNVLQEKLAEQKAAKSYR
jgi:hypothetical protein